MKNNKFDLAQAALAHSQGLLDKLHQPPQAPQQPTAQSSSPQSVPQETQQEEPQDTKLVDMFQTFMQEMRGLFQQDLQEDKKIESKLDNENGETTTNPPTI